MRQYSIIYRASSSNSKSHRERWFPHDSSKYLTFTFYRNSSRTEKDIFMIVPSNSEFQKSEYAYIKSNKPAIAYDWDTEYNNYQFDNKLTQSYSFDTLDKFVFGSIYGKQKTTDNYIRLFQVFDFAEGFSVNTRPCDSYFNIDGDDIVENFITAFADYDINLFLDLFVYNNEIILQSTKLSKIIEVTMKLFDERILQKKFVPKRNVQFSFVEVTRSAASCIISFLSSYYDCLDAESATTLLLTVVKCLYDENNTWAKNNGELLWTYSYNNTDCKAKASVLQFNHNSNKKELELIMTNIFSTPNPYSLIPIVLKVNFARLLDSYRPIQLTTDFFELLTRTEVEFTTRDEPQYKKLSFMNMHLNKTECKKIAQMISDTYLNLAPAVSFKKRRIENAKTISFFANACIEQIFSLYAHNQNTDIHTKLEFADKFIDAMYEKYKNLFSSKSDFVITIAGKSDRTQLISYCYSHVDVNELNRATMERFLEQMDNEHAISFSCVEGIFDKMRETIIPKSFSDTTIGMLAVLNKHALLSESEFWKETEKFLGFYSCIETKIGSNVDNSIFYQIKELPDVDEKTKETIIYFICLRSMAMFICNCHKEDSDLQVLLDGYNTLLAEIIKSGNGHLLVYFTSETFYNDSRYLKTNKQLLLSLFANTLDIISRSDDAENIGFNLCMTYHASIYEVYYCFKLTKENDLPEIAKIIGMIENCPECVSAFFAKEVLNN